MQNSEIRAGRHRPWLATHHTTSWVCHMWTLVEFDRMFQTFTKLILHIKEMVCCFVLDGSRRSHACVMEEASRLGCSYWKHGIALGQRPMSYHYEHITRNWRVRVPASYQSTIFNGPCTIGLRTFSEFKIVFTNSSPTFIFRYF